AQPLVALRAVGRHVEKVAAHAPDHVLMEALQQRVRALEPTAPLEVGVADDRDHVAGPELAGPTVHLDVPEAVEREARLPGFRRLAATERVLVGGSGQAEGPGAKLAVLEHLGVAQRHRLAGLTARR